MKRSILLLGVLAACGKGGSSRPAFDDKLMNPAAKGLKVGVATLDDVTKAFPTAEVHKDKSLGGDMIVEFNGKKAISIEGDGVSASIVDGKLVNLYVHGPKLYDWLVGTMDGMAGSKDCPGNRKMGKSGGEAAYCASAGDKVVFIDATQGSDRDELNYHLAK
jgi:hypothetical protein